MKPRLKLTSSGTLIVLIPGQNPWSEVSARKYVLEQYGSLQAFATRFKFPYSSVCIALRSSGAIERAGSVSTVRQVLGLPSRPTRIAQIVAAAMQGRRIRTGANV